MPSLGAGSLLVLSLFVFTVIAASAQSDRHENDPVKTNLSLLEGRVAEITRAILHQAGIRPGDSVTVRVDPSAERGITAATIASTLKEDSVVTYAHVDSGRAGRPLLAVTACELSVTYANMHRDGTFGNKKVSRRVFGLIVGEVTAAGSGAIVWSGRESSDWTDTVSVDEIPKIETSALPITHAELPAEDSIDRYVEPLIIIGATAVAVWLLFSVRS